MRIVPLIGIMLLLSVFSVSAFNQGEIEDMTCVNKTGLSFKFVNIGTSSMETQDMDIKVQIEGLAYNPPEKTKSPFTKGYNIPITGTWNKELLTSDEPSATYSSHLGFLFYPAQYRVTVGFPDCDPDFCKISKVNCKASNYCEITEPVRCVGVAKFGCDTTDLEIVHCRNTNEGMELKFKGLDAGLMMDVNPYDIEYAFYGDQSHIEKNLPEDTVIKEVEKDTYVLTFQRQGNNTIDRVRIKDGLICDHEVYANCKPWYISNEEQQGSTTQPSQPQQPIKESDATPVTGAAVAKMRVTSMVFIMMIIFLAGMVILRKRKNKN